LATWQLLLAEINMNDIKQTKKKTDNLGDTSC